MQEFIYDKMNEVETKHWWFQAKKNIIINLIKNKILPQYTKEIEIADIGCGVGLLLNSLSELGKVVGIDSSKQAIDFCKTSFNGELFELDCSSISSLNKKFDLVIASDLIEHIKDDQVIIKNIYDLLNPDGYAIITVPAFQFLWSQHDEEHMHYRRYNLDNLTELIRSANFKIEYISYYNFFLFIPAFIVRLIKKVFNIDKKSNLELTIPPSLINRLLFNIFKSEYKYISKNKRFPFGLSLLAIIKKS